MSDGRHEPFSVEIEQSVLGHAIRSNAAIDTLAAELISSDLYDPLHQRIMDSMLHLRASGSVTVMRLNSHMQGDPGLTGDTEGYIALLASAAPACHDLPSLLRTLKDLSGRRQLCEIGTNIADGAATHPSENPTPRLVSEATEALFKILSSDSRPEEHPSEVAAEVLDEADRALRGEKPPSIPTGFKKLDKAMGGIMAQETLLVPAQSGMGKSALLGSISLAAAKAGHPTLFFTKEMSAKQIVQRMLCDIDFDLREKYDQPIEYWKFRAGCLSNFEIARLRRAKAVLDDLPLRFRDDAGLTMSGLISRSRAFAGRYKDQLGLIVVDFMQIVKDDNPGKNDTRENVVSRLAYGHKELAKMLGWGVMAAVQMLNKGNAHFNPSQDLPTAEAIRESGAIEQSGDIIISPYRKAFFHKRKEPVVPHDRDEWKTWREKMDELDNDFWLRGMKLRGGDPSVLNIELWAAMGSSAIRDERPGRYHLPSENDESDSRPF